MAIRRVLQPRRVSTYAAWPNPPISVRSPDERNRQRAIVDYPCSYYSLLSQILDALNGAQANCGMGLRLSVDIIKE